MIPNFFIVGTPKAGTTSLYYYLEEHPDIYMSPIKETNFFSFDEIKSQGLFYNEEHISSRENYLAQFEGVTSETAVGEASVSYLYYPDVPAKLKKFNPNTKIIIVLRNPIDRGFSHYLMDKRLGFVNMEYKDIINKKNTDKKTKLYYQQYVELGLYYEQLKRYYSVFESHQIKVFLYEELTQNINKVVKQVYEFLNVNADFTPDLNTKHNTFLLPKNPLIQYLYKYKFFRRIIKTLASEKLQAAIKKLLFSKEKKPVLDSTLKKELIKIYKEDIDKTAKFLNVDLQHWYKN